MIKEFRTDDSAAIVIPSGFSVFCDLDGTLVYTDHANYLSYRRAVLEVTQGRHDIKSTDERLNRKTLMEQIPSLTAAQLKLVASLKSKYFKEYLPDTQLNTTLSLLITKGHKKNKMVLVTRCRKKRALEVLKYHKLLECFDQLIFWEDLLQVESSNKYESAVFLTGDSQKSVMILENDDNDIEEAIAAGVPKSNIYRVVSGFR